MTLTRRPRSCDRGGRSPREGRRDRGRSLAIRVDHRDLVAGGIVLEVEDALSGIGDLGAPARVVVGIFRRVAARVLELDQPAGVVVAVDGVLEVGVSISLKTMNISILSLRSTSPTACSPRPLIASEPPIRPRACAAS